MKSHNTKWLTFYGAAIALVIALFSGATHYGEANLQAPPRIAGRYKITAKNLPGCLRGKALILAIEQSGIYLNGSLLDPDRFIQSTAHPHSTPSLTGQFSPPHLKLSGTIPQIANCENATLFVQSTSLIPSTIAQTTLQGNLRLNQTAVDFTAKRDLPQDNSKKETTLKV